MKANPADPLNIPNLEQSCGIGVEVSPEQVEECVSQVISVYQGSKQD